MPVCRTTGRERERERERATSLLRFIDGRPTGTLIFIAFENIGMSI